MTLAGAGSYFAKHIVQTKPKAPAIHIDLRVSVLAIFFGMQSKRKVFPNRLVFRNQKLAIVRCGCDFVDHDYNYP